MWQLTSGRLLNLESPLRRHEYHGVSGTSYERESIIKLKLSLDMFSQLVLTFEDLLFDITHIEAKYCTEPTFYHKRRFYHYIKAVARGVLNSTFKRQNSRLLP